MQLKYSFILAETLWGKKFKHKYWRIRLEILLWLNFGFPLSSPIPNSEISPIYQSEQIFEKYYNFFSQNKFWTNQNNSGLSNGNSELTKLFREIYIGFWMKLNHWWRWNCHESIECLWSFVKVLHWLLIIIKWFHEYFDSTNLRNWLSLSTFTLVHKNK